MTHPEREEVEARIEAAVAPIITELRWQRWLIAAILAVVASPKFGGPSVSSFTASVIDVVL